MKSFQSVGVTLFVLLAFGVLTAASASATPTFLLAEWLLDGSAVSTEFKLTMTGELLLEDTALKADILCSMILDGLIGPSSLGILSEVLTLAGASQGIVLATGTGIECVSQSTCASSPPPLVWAVNLPWESEIELMEEEGKIFFTELFTAQNGGNVTYYLECTVLGIKSSDECGTSPVIYELSLEGMTLFARFSPAFMLLAEGKLSTCTFAGGETGIIEGASAFALTGGGELTASSEGVVA